MGPRGQAARQAGVGAGRLAAPAPITTAYTLSLGEPAEMRERAAENAHRPLLKVKLGSSGDLARIEAVRAGRRKPRSSWTPTGLERRRYAALALNSCAWRRPRRAAVSGRRRRNARRNCSRAARLCGRGCHDSATLGGLVGKYDAINIKLDKTGGLTEALRLKRQAVAAGFEIMVGCMLGTSLSMAPAQLLAQDVRYVDLDGPLLLARDRDGAIRYEGSLMAPASSSFWG